MPDLLISVKNYRKSCPVRSLATYVCAALFCTLLSGCGGGGSAGSKASSSPTISSFSGTAAVGMALDNATVTAKCLNGTTTTTTNSLGAYSLALSSAITLPCILRASSGNNTFYSAIYSGQSTANITPITQLIVSNALHSDPTTAFNTFSAALAGKLTASNIASSTTIVKSALATSGITLPSGTDPLTGQFKAATTSAPGDTLDNCIDSLMNALRQAALSDSSISLSSITTGLAAVTSSSQANTFMTSKQIVSNSVPSQMDLASNAYDMGTLPLLSGYITTLTSTQIGYADPSTGTYINLIGTFQFSGQSLSNANAYAQYHSDCQQPNPPTNAECVWVNLPGASGTITAIGQYNSNKQLVMSITKLNISESTFENLFETSDLFHIWQLILESNGGLLVTNNGTKVTCPPPASGSSIAKSITTSSANQNIESFFVSNCTQ